MAESWRPDWRDAKAYPQRLAERQWRWEFLRRCEEYQADFAEHHPAYFAAKMAHPLGTEPAGGYESHYRRLATMPDCRAKYGVTILLDPSEPNPGLGLFVVECPFMVGFASERVFAEMESDHIVLMAFDLKRPLKPQLEHAQKHLAADQAEDVGTLRERRNHRVKWARYLRVLDAKSEGARALEIATTLRLKPTKGDAFDPERLVSEITKQARTVQLRFKHIA